MVAKRFGHGMAVLYLGRWQSLSQGGSWLVPHLACTANEDQSLTLLQNHFWRCLLSSVAESCLKTWLNHSNSLRGSQTVFSPSLAERLSQSWENISLQMLEVVKTQGYTCSQGLSAAAGRTQICSGWHRGWEWLVHHWGRLGTAALGLRSCHLTLGTCGSAFCSHIFDGYQSAWVRSYNLCVFAHIYFFCGFIKIQHHNIHLYKVHSPVFFEILHY